MSRKREQKREQKRELARQLGVDKDDVPAELQAHARVTEPEVKLALDVDAAKRGLLTRAHPLHVFAALYVVDAQGARFVRVVSMRAEPVRAATRAVPLHALLERGEDKLRYTRPGRFVVVALAIEAPEDPAAPHAVVDALTDVAAMRAVIDASARVEEPRSIDVPDAVRTYGAKATFTAASFVSIAAAHRVQDTARMPLVVDDKLKATLAVSLRL